jgi:hypothetical protein
MDEATIGAQVDAFEHGVPTAHVVRLPHATHFVWISNEADVLREMNAFIATGTTTMNHGSVSGSTSHSSDDRWPDESARPLGPCSTLS